MRRRGLYCPIATLIVLLAWGITEAVPRQETAKPVTTQRDLKRVRLEDQQQPWLRINSGGHTGRVHALAFTPDSGRLCSAGSDKVVQVWNLAATQRDLRRVFLRERTIRWQVARGRRGNIYAAATAPGKITGDGLLAIGGYGAMGTLGEILLINPLDGTLIKHLDKHRQTVCSLAFSADGNWLASSDVSGRATLWQRGDWRPITLLLPDEQKYSRKWVEQIRRLPKRRPITIAGNRHVFVPVLEEKGTGDRVRWRLRQVDLATRKAVSHLDARLHRGMVTALAATADGSRLASADLAGNLYLWDLAGDGPSSDGSVKRLNQNETIFSLAFSPDGRTLVAGTAVAKDSEKSQLQIWNLRDDTFEVRRSLPDHVYSCAVSPDGQRVAYSGDGQNAVLVEPLAAGGKVVRLQGTGRRIFKVAFAKQEPYYRVAFGSDYRNRGLNDLADLQQTFDPVKLALGAAVPLDPEDWISFDRYRGNWQAKVKDGSSLELLQNGRARKTIDFDPRLEGRVRCWCWIPDEQGTPAAIAVALDLQNSIFVYRLGDDFPILRHFRDHQDLVSSMSVSHKGEYLVSGSVDGTAKIWSLSGCLRGEPMLSRWGVRLQVGNGKDAADGDRLVATWVDEAGPLYRKGLRPSDVLTRIRWLSDPTKPPSEETQPAAMLRRLQRLAWGTQVKFEFTRKGRGDSFQLLPAWQPLATLFVDTKQEWAFWTPEGYYDASFNGYRLFGWQVNRGLSDLPSFYRADQFYKKLERPDVLEHLLPGGNLQEAFRRAAVAGVAALPPGEENLHEALPKQILATPRIRILTPRPGILVVTPTTKVTAEVTVPPGSKIVGAKAVANGVAVFASRPVRESDLAEGKKLVYELDLPLPSDEQALIQFSVETDAPTAAIEHVVVEHRKREPPPRPRLFILAVGINEYTDPEIPGLNFSVADAEGVIEKIRSGSQELYTLDEATLTLLTNEQVTPQAWKASIEKLSKELEDRAKPDDLLVFFLAGHGVVHPANNRYYFVGHKVKLADFYEKNDFSECISWNDFRSLANLPCRKLALLDTCHAGAIQPPRSRNLKSAVRHLQENVIFTVTASTGEQKSAEKKDWGHGAFTKCLLEALGGQADRSQEAGQGIVTLDEMVDYVKQSVPKLTGGVQTPTAAPDEFLRYTSLPLTRVEGGGR